jgi:hypothetical protein
MRFGTGAEQRLRLARHVRAAAAAAALAALLVVPVLHGVHAPHDEASAAFTSFAPGSGSVSTGESTVCSICFGAGQARAALATAAAGDLDTARFVSQAPPGRTESATVTMPRAPCAPRAPPLSA